MISLNYHLFTTRVALVLAASVSTESRDYVFEVVVGESVKDDYH